MHRYIKLSVVGFFGILTACGSGVGEETSSAQASLEGDPFDPASCTGSPITADEARGFFSGSESKVQLEHAMFYAERQTCYLGEHGFCTDWIRVNDWQNIVELWLERSAAGQMKLIVETSEDSSEVSIGADGEARRFDTDLYGHFMLPKIDAGSALSFTKSCLQAHFPIGVESTYEEGRTVMHSTRGVFLNRNLTAIHVTSPGEPKLDEAFIVQGETETAKYCGVSSERAVVVRGSNFGPDPLMFWARRDPRLGVRTLSSVSDTVQCVPICADCGDRAVGTRVHVAKPTNERSSSVVLGLK